MTTFSALKEVRPSKVDPRSRFADSELPADALSFVGATWLSAVDSDVDVVGVALVGVLVVVVARMRRRNGQQELLRVEKRHGADASVVHRVPVTKLGRLVKDGKIKSIEEIYLFSLPVKEFQASYNLQKKHGSILTVDHRSSTSSCPSSRMRS